MEHFPSVLDPVAFPPTPTPPVSRSPRKAAAAALALASSPHSFFVPTPVSTSEHPKPPPPPIQVLGATFSPAALSLAPAILSLNLQLQSFVELLRTANSTSRASTPTRSDSPMSGSTSSLASVGKSAGGGMGKVIKQGQKLAAKVATLPVGKERASWEQEILEVSGLMAYTDLSICPVRGYLSQDRREALAELVNAAILRELPRGGCFDSVGVTDSASLVAEHLKRTPMPVLALVARQTSSVWQTLAEWKHPFPPPEPGQPKSRSKVCLILSLPFAPFQALDVAQLHAASSAQPFISSSDTDPGTSGVPSIRPARVPRRGRVGRGESELSRGAGIRIL